LDNVDNHTWVVLSDYDELNINDEYWLNAWVFDFQGRPVAPAAAPRVTLYRPNRTTEVVNVAMSLNTTGFYIYNYTTDLNDEAGTWEAWVNTTLTNGHNSVLSDFWEIDASPAQVVIHSITDNTVQSITADVTIENEGNAGYEYGYAFCIVDDIDNDCGGGDDVDYSSGAKYINKGVAWRSDMTLTVNDPGVYYFKVIVYYGTEWSSASRRFEAVRGGWGGASYSSGSGGGNPLAITPENYTISVTPSVVFDDLKDRMSTGWASLMASALFTSENAWVWWVIILAGLLLLGFVIRTVVVSKRGWMLV